MYALPQPAHVRIRKATAVLTVLFLLGLTLIARSASATVELYSRCNAGAIYYVNASGALYWYGDSVPDSDGGLSSGVQIGSGWSGFTSVFAGGAGVIYAIKSDGTLLRYRHLGYGNGANSWAGPYTIGTGWSGYNAVVSGGNGVIYAISSDGALHWYRDLDPMGSSWSWASGSGATLGTGWSGFGSKFYSAGNGVLYGIKSDGTLHWYRHLDPFGGSASWDSNSGVQIGAGWGGFQSLIQEGAGVMYAVQSDGTLRFYHHLDSYGGSYSWSSGTSFSAGWGPKVTADPTSCMKGDRNDVTFLKNSSHNWLMRYSWDDSQQSCLVTLWNAESNWIWSADNPTSGAYGIPQSLPASKMSTSGADYLDNPYTQIDWGLGYISSTYGTPCDAWSFHQANGWY